MREARIVSGVAPSEIIVSETGYRRPFASLIAVDIEKGRALEVSLTSSDAVELLDALVSVFWRGTDRALERIEREGAEQRKKLEDERISEGYKEGVRRTLEDLEKERVRVEQIRRTLAELTADIEALKELVERARYL